MKKKYLFLVLFGLILIPLNSSQAITQSQINAEVQIVCTDGADNWFSGSGTIIDPKGIILTNRHVVEGAYKNTCFIGFLESINQEPNFGSKDNPNLAEVKYYTTTDDMDSAVLYLDNSTNKIYPYINIWDSNSASLKFGDKIEVIGYPGIGGSTITYTSGDFSGFGSQSDGTQNYIKTTALLEHGNSGGSAYNQNGEFVGIPSMVVTGSLNSISYVLSVDSIKKWLSGFLGNDYKQEIIEQKPIIVEQPEVKLQNDITPPLITNSALGIYGYDENNKFIKYSEINNSNNATIYEFPKVSFGWFQNCEKNQYGMYVGTCINDNESSVAGYYYYFGSNATAIPEKDGIYIAASDMSKDTIYKHDLTYKSQVKLPVVFEINKNSSNFFILQAKDVNGNISNPLITFQYVYEAEEFKYLNKISFFKDGSLTKILSSYDVNFTPLLADKGYWYKGSHELLCYTKLNSLTIQWEYPNNFSKYSVKNFNSFRPLVEVPLNGEEIKQNYYTISNLKNGKNIRIHYGYPSSSSELNKIENTQQKYFEFYLKPMTSSSGTLSEKHSLVDIIYDPNIKNDIECSGQYFTKNNAIVDYALSNKLKGYILLQTESHGEAWYVNPKDSKKYYMANGNKAYDIMRYFGIGITNKDLDKIKSSKTFAKKSSGKIFLQVESRGEAYYIDFNGNANYLKDGAAAYEVMRSLGLGITNSNLNKISEGRL